MRSRQKGERLTSPKRNIIASSNRRTKSDARNVVTTSMRTKITTALVCATNNYTTLLNCINKPNMTVSTVSARERTSHDYYISTARIGNSLKAIPG